MKNILHKFITYKNGFTLAEVLITLVIIGVIAALTIPTAINNTKEQELKSQFAKAYSTISQGLNKTVMNDFYGCVDCAYFRKAGSAEFDYTKTKTSDCPAFYEALAKNLQVQKVCKGNSKADGCIPAYKSYASGSGCTGFNQNHVENINHSYVLANGQIINIYGGNGGALFLVDINGHKGPNAPGYDLFGFKIARSEDNLTSYYIDFEACMPPASGGRNTYQMMQYALIGKK